MEDLEGPSPLPQDLDAQGKQEDDDRDDFLGDLVAELAPEISEPGLQAAEPGPERADEIEKSRKSLIEEAASS